jgi:hypothetical protein
MPELASSIALGAAGVGADAYNSLTAARSGTGKGAEPKIQNKIPVGKIQWKTEKGVIKLSTKDNPSETDWIDYKGAIAELAVKIKAQIKGDVTSTNGATGDDTGDVWKDTSDTNANAGGNSMFSFSGVKKSKKRRNKTKRHTRKTK